MIEKIKYWFWFILSYLSLRGQPFCQLSHDKNSCCAHLWSLYLVIMYFHSLKKLLFILK